MSKWFISIVLFESIVFILSVIFYRSLKRSKLVTLPYFLFFVLAGELMGQQVAKWYHSNIAYYNIFSSLQIIYYLLLIYYNICSTRTKKIFAYCIAFFVLVTIGNYFLIGEGELVSYSFATGFLLITLGSAYFFYELLLSPAVENYLTYPLFWIMLGLFVFYVCNIPYMSVYNYLSLNFPKIHGAYFKIIEILNYLMYSFFIIGIICSSRTKSHLH
jgi:hypothetical protein